jgi:hypothetical protein
LLRRIAGDIGLTAEPGVFNYEGIGKALEGCPYSFGHGAGYRCHGAYAGQGGGIEHAVDERRGEGITPCQLRTVPVMMQDLTAVRVTPVRQTPYAPAIRPHRDFGRQ